MTSPEDFSKKIASAESVPLMTTCKKAAEDALNSADCKILHRLFLEKCGAVQTLVDALEVMVGEGKLGVRPTSIDRPVDCPTENVISAMRDIALAAIQLARDVSIPPKM